MTKQQHLKELAIQYNTIQTDLAILEGKKKELNEQVKKLMGGEKKIDLPNGWYWHKYPMTRISYDPDLTRSLLGDKLAWGVMKVDSKGLENLLDDMLVEDVKHTDKWVGTAARLKYERIVESETMALKLVTK